LVEGINYDKILCDIIDGKKGFLHFFSSLDIHSYPVTWSDDLTNFDHLTCIMGLLHWATVHVSLVSLHVFAFSL